MNLNKGNAHQELISGIIERITYHNAENGFCVLQVKVPRMKDLVTVVGSVSSISAGEYITATGNWLNDRTHGMQFKATFLKASTPTSIEGIEKYLGSGLIKGIGPIYAKKLVSKFGVNVFDIIENHPTLLRDVEGIGPFRSNTIIQGWADQKIIREIMLFLHEHKVSTARAVRIYKTYGIQAIKVVSENPYRLAKDIKGIGFITADQIAKNLGIKADSMIRAKAGIEYILLEATDEGHCGLPKAELLNRAEKVLEVNRIILEKALQLEIQEQNLILDKLTISLEYKEAIEFVFLSGLYNLEKFIASQIRSRISDIGNVAWPYIDSTKAIPWVEEKLNINLAETQVEAVCLAIKSKLLVITGGPGVGKTTIMSSILNILKAKNVKVLLCAPTGRAAKKLSESTKLEAKTIHRLLEVSPANGEFKYNQQNQLDCELLVIDETSMVDIYLMSAILKALPPTSALLLVGDVDQLPSVGPGKVLQDIIDSQIVPTVRLREIFRQAQTSQIITNAHRINKGLMPDFKSKQDADFYFIECKDPEDGMNKVKEIVKNRIPRKYHFNPIQDIQVLSPMNRGYLGAHSLNIELQKILNTNHEPKVERFGRSFCIGDKVIQTQNDYDKEVYNGDIGYVRNINLDANEIIIEFDARPIIYDFGELDQLQLAYCITIHKSQGSEYPVVVIPITMQHYTMLKKNLIYTAITRGKKLVIIVGQKKALAIAITKKDKVSRYSKLREWL